MKRTEPYTGPFPRKRHSHRCLSCGGNAVACYKSQCKQPQTVEHCRWCPLPAKEPIEAKPMLPDLIGMAAVHYAAETGNCGEQFQFETDVCITGNPALNGVCGEDDCPCK